MTLNRLNVSLACDTCKSRKTKCYRVVSTVSTTKCTQCIKHNRECTYNEGKKRGPKPKSNHNPTHDNSMTLEDSSNEIYNEDEIFHGLSAEEKKYFSSIYTKEQLIQILKILRSFTPQPCPFKNIVGHLCHRGCFVRYNNFN
ncbi:nuclear protein [Gigaspora margarita]|uniref:Nuclear protein n=1 Tax=Gigaspora margarita TaxID=4874 RepID=A0A8H4AUH8_GIGMA|nr:nuclear protein [Gigaspora margarita]